MTILDGMKITAVRDPIRAALVRRVTSCVYHLRADSLLCACCQALSQQLRANTDDPHYRQALILVRITRVGNARAKIQWSVNPRDLGYD